MLTTATSSATSTTISGTLASVANTTFRIEFFSNQALDGSGFGEGQTYLGFATVTTDGSGNATFTATGLVPAPVGQGYLSATATNLTTNDTSGFGKGGELAVATLTSSASPSVFGQPVTFTADLSAFAGSSTPSGSLDFVDTTTHTDLGSVSLSGGTAALTTSALGVGDHIIQAVYGGDGNFQSSTSEVLALTVNQDGTTTKLTSSSSTAAHDTPVTFTATVLPVSPGSGTPTGTVSLYDGSTPLGTVNLSGGVAQLAYPFATMGKHKIKTAEWRVLAPSAQRCRFDIPNGHTARSGKIGGSLQVRRLFCVSGHEHCFPRKCRSQAATPCKWNAALSVLIVVAASSRTTTEMPQLSSVTCRA